MADPKVKSLEGFGLVSPSFVKGGKIPAKYTCDGENVSPPLSIVGVPKEAKSLALIVEDPDAPGGVFTHWILWNIIPQTTMIGENSVPEGAVQGKTDFGAVGWGGPCPPSGTHRYFFKLYALDTTLNLDRGADKQELVRAMEDHILSGAELMGLYSR